MSYSPRMKRIRQLRLTKKYLEILGNLLGRVVSQSELGSIEQVPILQESSKKFVGAKASSYEIPFEDRRSNYFEHFIKSLREANGSPVYLWVSYAEDCGLLLLPSIEDMNFDFSFDVDGNGVMSLETKDLSDRLLLDFFKDDDGSERLTIRVQGEHWKDIPLQRPSPGRSE